MDDYSGSADYIDKAVQLARDLVEVQKRTHFEVRGWVSNEPSVSLLYLLSLGLTVPLTIW